MGKLSATRIKTILDRPGRYSDGDGLILFVRSAGQASWVARFQHNGKRRDYGIGSAKLYPLSEARERAWQVRRAIADGRDPRLLWVTPAPLLLAFKDAAEDFFAKGNKAGERRQKQGRSQLARFAFPSLGKLQVQSIDADRIAGPAGPEPEAVRQRDVPRQQSVGDLDHRDDSAAFGGDPSPIAVGQPDALGILDRHA